MVGSEHKHLQSELWEKTNELFKNKKLPSALSDYVAELMATKMSGELKQCLKDISEVERVLVALNNVFHYCRNKDGVELKTVIKKLTEKNYSYDHLPDTLPDSSFPHRTYLQTSLSALKSGDYGKAVSQLFMLNADVMKQRSGAPWVELESGGKVRVRVKSETAELASIEKLEQRWDYDYFLGSYLAMSRAYLEGAHG